MCVFVCVYVCVSVCECVYVCASANIYIQKCEAFFYSSGVVSICRSLCYVCTCTIGCNVLARESRSLWRKCRLG